MASRPIQRYEDLIAYLAAVKRRRGLRHLDVDELAGFSAGFTGKVLSSPASPSHKRLSGQTLEGMLVALGVELVVVPRRRSRRKAPMPQQLCLPFEDAA